MINFENECFSREGIEKSDLFIACVGYEERSFYILDQITVKNRLVFTIDDYLQFDKKIVKKIENYNDTKNLCIKKYDDCDGVQKDIVERVIELKEEKENVRIDIDYSSMPRGWYGKIPEKLEPILTENDKIYFWYSEGDYSDDENKFTSVGIESYKVYSGRISFDVQRQRTHIIGVGFDFVRTQGIVSILDPERYIICNAFDPDRLDIRDSVLEVNKNTIEQAEMVMSIQLTDIKYMISKISSIVKELSVGAENDVILVPDGPKPLIFIMSMMPWLSGERGIVCMHILRNNKNFKKINVSAQGKIIGFSMTKALLDN